MSEETKKNTKSTKAAATKKTETAKKPAAKKAAAPKKTVSKAVEKKASATTTKAASSTKKSDVKTASPAKKTSTKSAASTKKTATAAKKTTATATKKTAAKSTKKAEVAGSATKKTAAKKKVTKPKQAAKPQFYGTGRRKSSVARVFMSEGEGVIQINGRDLSTYFPEGSHWKGAVEAPLELLAVRQRFDIKATVKGGGNTGQSGALKLGIARALLAFVEQMEEASLADHPWKLALRKGGFLTRDARRVWRKTPGLVKARKRKQFSKR